MPGEGAGDGGADAVGVARPHGGPRGQAGGGGPWGGFGLLQGLRQGLLAVEQGQPQGWQAFLFTGKRGRGGGGNTQSENYNTSKPTFTQQVKYL